MFGGCSLLFDVVVCRLMCLVVDCCLVLCVL